MAKWVGVLVALLGNVTISVALNVQKLAHKRIQDEDEAGAGSKDAPSPAKDAATEEQHGAAQRTPSRSTSRLRNGSPSERTRLLASQPLILSTPDRRASQVEVPTIKLVTPPVAVGLERPPNGRRDSSRRGKATPKKSKRPRVDKEFLHSKLWWCGFALMNLGEFQNFLAYAFAPSSLVAPLGTSALVANCFLAPLLLKEAFRKQDILGIVMCILGAVTVVISSKQSDKQLFPDEVMGAIAQVPFIVYSSISVALGICLGFLSQTSYADRWILIDLGLAAVAGAFTVLSTKAFSSFLSLIFLDTFKHWITYPILVLLVSTALIQVNFVNKSLQRFDSRIVIPTQFCTFSLSAIVGSAILYRDFDDVSGSMALNFVFGCALSCAGVYFLTKEGTDESGNNSSSSEQGAQARRDSSSAPRPVTVIAIPTSEVRRRGSLPVFPGGSSSFDSDDPETPSSERRRRTLSVNLGLGSQYLLVGASPTAGSGGMRWGSGSLRSAAAPPLDEEAARFSDTDGNTELSDSQEEPEESQQQHP